MEMSVTGAAMPFHLLMLSCPTKFVHLSILRIDPSLLSKCDISFAKNIHYDSGSAARTGSFVIPGSHHLREVPNRR